MVVRRAIVLVVAALLSMPMLWGQSKQAETPRQTFKARLTIGMGDVEVNFIVSQNGYDWNTGPKGYYHSNGVTPWRDVRKWSCTGERSGFALDIHDQTGARGFQFRHDDLVTVVNDYFKKYAGDKLESCNPEA